MPSTPSPRLRAELQALGENLNTWGDGRLNAALTRLEEAIADVVPIAITGTAYVLTSTNYVADEARGAALVITGTLTGNTTITAPTVEKLYLIDNRTTQGSYSLTIKTAAGTGYALRPGPQKVFCDGSDFARGEPRLDQVPLPASAVDMNAQRLTNLATPSVNSDAATKKYVDDTAFSAAAGNLPAQSGNAGRILTTDGSVAGWGPIMPNPAAADRRKVLSASSGGGGYDLRLETEPLWGGTATGTASALVATTGANLPALAVGQIIGLKTGGTPNPGAATLNVDGIGAKPIQKNGSALYGGELAVNTDVWFQYDGTNWRLFGGLSGLNLPITALSGAYPVTLADAGKLFDCSGTFQITLPAASSVPNGFAVTALNSGTGSVAVAASSGTVGGVASVALNQSEWAFFVSTGAAWKVLRGIAVSASGPVWSSTDKDASLVLSESNVRLTATGSGQFGSARAVNAFSDKRYFEFDIIATTTPTTSPYLGFATATASIAGGARFSASANGWAYNRSGQKENGGTITAFGSSYTASDNVGWAVDPVAGKAWVRINGVYQGSGDPVAGTNPTFTFTAGLTLYPAAYLDGNSVATDVRLRKIVNYATPSGFSVF